MKRVLVIGSPGSGKSTFSRKLSAISGLPLVHLDKEFWGPGWTEPGKNEWRARLERLLDLESWIMDGNYGGTMELRLNACDTAIFLDLPRLVCTWRILKRAIVHRGSVRPDMADGCPEKIDPRFLVWTWRYPTRSRPSVERRLAMAADRIKTYRLRSQKEVEEFLQKVKFGSGPDEL